MIAFHFAMYHVHACEGVHYIPIYERHKAKDILVAVASGLGGGTGDCMRLTRPSLAWPKSQNDLFNMVDWMTGYLGAYPCMPTCACGPVAQLVAPLFSPIFAYVQFLPAIFQKHKMSHTARDFMLVANDDQQHVVLENASPWIH